MGSKPKKYKVEFKIEVARRMVAGESATKLSQEVGVNRPVLYCWRDRYRAQGEAGLAQEPGRPPTSRSREGSKGIPDQQEMVNQGKSDAAAQRITELEKKVGKQAMQIDFFTRAFRRVRESRQNKEGSGATASTEKSKV